MIPRTMGKRIAGNVFVNHFGEDFVRANMGKLGTEVLNKKDSIRVDFVQFPIDVDKFENSEKKIGLSADFVGRFIFSVDVNLTNGKHTIVDVSEVE